MVGAGERGSVYAQYAAALPSKLKVVSVCEPRAAHRRRMAANHSASLFMFVNMFVKNVYCTE